MGENGNKNELTAGYWVPGDFPPESGDAAIHKAILKLKIPVVLITKGNRLMSCRGGMLVMGDRGVPPVESYPLAAYVPALHPENLGDSRFKQQYGLKFAYVVGAMANGITSVDMVEAAGKAGMLGFFGSAGLSLDRVETAIDRLQQQMKTLPFGFNLIHSPNEPELESGVVDLYLRKGIKLVSASAYMDMTLPLVFYRVKGIYRNENGDIVCPQRVVAKVSRVEVARKFFAPPPDKFLKQLLERKLIGEDEALLARKIPMADALTAEADSGGHTDNRPAITLLSTMLTLRDEMAKQHLYDRPLFVGLGGGIATPDSAAAAFSMGAAYILTGSVNQACVEAGTSETVRSMLAQVGQADVTMAPAADMFELGVKVQVLKRGTMFPFRAGKLYDLYSRFGSYDELPEKERALLEKDFFRKGFSEEWAQTQNFFMHRDPPQVQRAERDPKHKMALVFRSYLGQSSNWANTGEPSRQLDYQIWCGPAMGAFNAWVKGTFLELPVNRRTVTVALNLLYGAAVATRTNWLGNQGIQLPGGTGRFVPLNIDDLTECLAC
ncbi:PfaD family polyunsaturated fatty acid/polyketide biosynthesis protein [Thermodesulfobacteriota bacterium]